MAEEKDIRVDLSDETIDRFTDRIVEGFAHVLATNLSYGGQGLSDQGGTASVPPPRGQPIGRTYKDEPVPTGFSNAQLAQEGITPPQGSPSGSRSKDASLPPISALFGRGGRDAFGRFVSEGETDAVMQGLLPNFFGGDIGWQQMAQIGTQFGRMAVQGRKDPDNTRWDGRLGDFALDVGRYSEFVDQNALQIQAIQTGFRKLQSKGNQFESLGASLGTVPGEGFGSSLGPVRLPFINPQARKGIEAAADSWLSAGLTPGISVKEDLQLKEQLASLGYIDGSDRARELLGESSGGILGIGGHTPSGLRELQQYDPRLADFEMMDQATRYGAQSVDDFVRSMKGIPDAAQAANVSVEQMMQDMKSMGEWSQANGGTWASGAAIAPMWSAMTGTSAAVGQSLLQSPLTQGQIYRDTGMMPEMQAALDPMTIMQSTIAGFDQNWRNAGNFRTKIIRDAQGRVIDRVTGVEQKAAMVANQYGLSPEVVTNLAAQGNLKNWLSGIHGRSVATGGLAAIEAGITASQHGNAKAESKWNRAAARNLRDARKMMTHAVDDEGNKLFDTGEIHDLLADAGNSAKGIGADGDVSNLSDSQAEDVGKFMESHGYKKKDEGVDWKDYLEDQFDSGKADARKIRRGYIRQRKLETLRSELSIDEGERAANGGDSMSDQMIDLTPYAKQYFQMVDPGSRATATANAGGAPTNTQYTNPGMQSPYVRPSK